LDQAHEGIMAVRSAVVSTLLLSLLSGRIMVEPCVKDGAVVPCGSTIGTVRMSTLLEVQHEVWATIGGHGHGWWSYERFSKVSRRLGFDPVNDRTNVTLPHSRQDCALQGWSDLPTVQRRLHKAPFVVSLVDQLNQNLCLLDDNVAFELSLRLLVYPTTIVEAAATAVRPLLKDRPLHVVHWRTIHLPAETFERCARWVGRMIEAIATGPTSPLVYLLTDLPALNDSAMKWGDNRYSFAPERRAWQQVVASSPYLIHPKFDQTNETLDAGTISLLEQSIAMQAGALTTCGWKNRTAACLECNYVGKFTRVLVGLRERQTGKWVGLPTNQEPTTNLDWPLT